MQVLQGLSIEEHVAVPSQQTAFGRGRLFRLRLQFFPEHLYPPEAGITFADVAQVFKTSFMLKLQVCTSLGCGFVLFLGYLGCLGFCCLGFCCLSFRWTYERFCSGQRTVCFLVF